MLLTISLGDKRVIAEFGDCMDLSFQNMCQRILEPAMQQLLFGSMPMDEYLWKQARFNGDPDWEKIRDGDRNIIKT